MTNTVKCISPIDGSLYAERPVLEQEAALEAVMRAKAAQVAWAARPLSERIALVQAGVAAVGAMNDEIVPELRIKWVVRFVTVVNSAALMNVQAIWRILPWML